MRITRRGPESIVLLAALLVAGCGGDEQTLTFPGPGADVFFTFPYADQENVSTHAPVVVRVSDPVLAEVDLDEALVLTRDGQNVDASVELAAESGDRTLLLRPQEPLTPNTDYRVEINDLVTEAGPVQLAEGDFGFRTRALEMGPRSLITTDDMSFTITRMIPDGDELPIMDFSSLRFEFTQPLYQEGVRYGDNVVLEDSGGELVDAEIVMQGRFMTVDPVDKLVPGESYSVTFSGDLPNRFGETLAAEYSTAFVPKKSGPTETMNVTAPPGGRTSLLTGETVNLVPVISTVLGGEDGSPRSQQGGTLGAELAFVPNFPDVTPMRVPRGTRLEGEELEILLGGEISAGIDSGTLTVELASDAVGFLLPNRHSDRPDAPRELRMFMDLSAFTAEPEAHAGFTQDVLHLEVVGQAIVKDGVLQAEGITVVETDILGVETSHGTLGFFMEEVEDQLNPPEKIGNQDPPEVLSWMPGEEFSNRQRPGVPIIVNFTEAMNLSKFEGNVEIERGDGTTVPVDAFTLRQDGGALVINTELEYGQSYKVKFHDGITDRGGNSLASTTLEFEMPEFGDGPVASPMVLTAYPGFPCVTTGRELDAGHVGQCAGGMDDDDFLPLPTMPADREIRVHFSQIMNQDSLTEDAGFRVEKVDEQGAPIETVEGDMEIRERELTFMPREPWEEGALYRYVLASNGDNQSSQCNPDTMICSQAGLPLLTEHLAANQDPDNAPDIDGGGADMEIYFRASEPLTSAFAHLDNVPTADVNSNSLHDPEDGNPVDDPEFGLNSIETMVEGTDGAISDARIGCPVDQEEDCPRDKFAYLTGALNVEIGGFLDPGEAEEAAVLPLPQDVQDNGGILFHIYPTIIRATNLVAYAETSAPGTEADPADTGPMVMRVRYQCDARPDGADPDPDNAEALDPCEEGENPLPEAWIVEGEDGPEVIATFNTYLDAPALEPVVRLFGVPSTADHNAYSQGLSAGARGPVKIQEDGRIQIGGINADPVDAELEIVAAGVLSGTVTLRIPAQGLNLNFLSEAPRR